MNARLPKGPAATITRYASGNRDHLTRMRDAWPPWPQSALTQSFACGSSQSRRQFVDSINLLAVTAGH